MVPEPHTSARQSVAVVWVLYIIDVSAERINMYRHYQEVGTHAIPIAPELLSGHPSCAFGSIPLISPPYTDYLQETQILKPQRRFALIVCPP